MTLAAQAFRAKMDRFINSTSVELVVAVLIMASVSLILAEASLSPRNPWMPLIELVNDLLTGLFIVELSIRAWVEPRKMRFLRRYWVDILSVLPLMRAFRMLRILRLLRLFRVGMTVGKHLNVFTTSFRFIRLEYLLISLSILTSILMGALSLRVAEGKNPAFNTFGETIWFAAMTLVAGEPIGGDPETTVGRMITLTLMMGGLTVFAIFTGTVSAVMIETLRNMKFRHMEIDEIKDHLVICGWNRVTEMILDELLHKSDFSEIVVVAESRDIEEHPLYLANTHRIFFVHGDYTRMHVLKEAGVERALVAILLADESKEERSAQDRDARTVLAALLIEKMTTKNIFTTVQLLNRDNETSLREAGVEEIIVTDQYVGNIMASVVRNRGIVSLFNELLTSKWGNQFHKQDCPDFLVGMTVKEAMIVLKDRYDATLVAIATDSVGTDMVVNPPGDLELLEGHRIVIAAAGDIS